MADFERDVKHIVCNVLINCSVGVDGLVHERVDVFGVLLDDAFHSFVEFISGWLAPPIPFL